MSSQLIGVLAASTQGDADAKSLQTGAWVAGMLLSTTSSTMRKMRSVGSPKRPAKEETRPPVGVRMLGISWTATEI